jgi:hypothetical protein
MKYKFILGSNDQVFNISLTGRNDILGYDDNVENLINSESDNSINDVSDAEVRRILPISASTLNFNFWNTGTTSYVSTIAPNEFTSNDLYKSTLINSFYIIQVYNNFKEEIQKKYHTGYFNGYEFGVTSITSTYNFNLNLEFSNLYISQDLLNSMNGNDTDYYAKFSFYSAKTGKIYSFYNGDITSNTQNKLYCKISINPNTLKYRFYNSPTNLFELKNTIYDAYIKNTVPSYSIEKTTYPSGTTFTNEGKYVII